MIAAPFKLIKGTVLRNELRMVQWTLGLDDGDSQPLYHVEWELNIADLLTKEHLFTVEDVREGSLWQTGPEWLIRSVSLMQLKKYIQVFMWKEEEKVALQECYSDSEPFMTAGEIEVEPSCPGLFSVEPLENQPLATDGLYLPFNLVLYSWIKARSLTMKLLNIMDL